MVPPSATRTLSTAEVRREAVLEAAARVCATQGLHAPTLKVAQEAGISQAYLFRLFPTKAELANAVVERCMAKVHDTFAAVAAQAIAQGEDPFAAMGVAYGELLADGDLLRLQMQAFAAATNDDQIRATVQAGFKRLVELVQSATDAPDEIVQGFFAHGMLMNVLAAAGATQVDAPWAKVLGCL